MAKRRRNTAGFLQIVIDLVLRNLYLVVIGIVLFFVGRYIHEALLHSDYFTVKNIEMMCLADNKRIIGPKTILQLKKGVNIFQLDLKKCRTEIETAHPEIKDVKASKILPDRVSVFYHKRKPFCQVKSAKYYLVSKEAVVLPMPSNYAYKDLPIVVGIYISESHLPKDRKITGPSMQKALQLIEQIEQTDFEKKYKIAEIDVYDESNPIIYLENGIQIKVGERNFKDREPRLLEVLKDLKAKGLKPKAIDLRFEDIVVTPLK